MVATRGNKEDIVPEKSPISRETRKASRGALEEPQDEIFWDSDEAKLSATELKTTSPLPSNSSPELSKSAKVTKTSPVSDQLTKDKDSPRVGGCSSLSPSRSEGKSMDASLAEENQPSSTSSLQSPESQHHQQISLPSKKSPKPVKPLIRSRKSVDSKPPCKHLVTEMPLKKGRRTRGSLEAPLDIEAAKTSPVNNNKRLSGKEIVDIKMEEEAHIPLQSNGDDEEEGEELEQTNMDASDIVENGSDDEDFDDQANGLRRSSRRSRPTWLVGPRKLRGYPSPGGNKDGQDSRFVEDSEDGSEEDVIYAVKGRYGRLCRRPKRYQEDTEEEEEISRGKGKPRGNKGSLRRQKNGSRAKKMRGRVSKGGRGRRLSDVEEDERSESVTARSRRRLPRVTYMDIDTDEEEYGNKMRRASRKTQENREEKQSDEIGEEETEPRDVGDEQQDEEVEESEGEEDIKEKTTQPTRRRRKKRAREEISEDDKLSEGEEETEDDGRGRKKGKQLDPILRNEDCLEYARSIDSYSGKKRTRRPVMRLSYSTDAHNRGHKEGDSTSPSSSSSSSDEDGEGFEGPKGYSLRRRDRKPSLPFEHNFTREKRARAARRRGDHVPTFLGSPARKPINYKRRTTHNKSSTSSSDDERRFENRRQKSNAKIRDQMRPMNFGEEDMQNLIIKERSKVGSSLADVEPMAIDRSVTFSAVGGLGPHIRSLREMVVLPLLYPEIFSRFNVSPPRGVLFFGPPGTGKTLVARALANECSKGEKQVAFFMRKGADCLSKWVGESERQLRLLFDQAYQMRPSIIFFDEIDGLAPVRSSRQDQIHSSIVSTLLALMDGLDSRGEVIVIGATNRIEAIDPALRRPGRFDRELCFPLPSAKAREQILRVHTNSWSPRPRDRLLRFLAEHTPGYCGADLKSLCCEAVLTCLKRKYPQVYQSSVKLQIDSESLNVQLKHFRAALSRIVPAGHRSRSSVGRRLHNEVKPLLQRPLDKVLEIVAHLFPQGLTPSGGDREVMAKRMLHSTVCCRPRLLLSASKGQGDTTHLAPAIIHAMERVPVHKLDFAALFANSSRTPEEAVAQVLHEACSRPPSIIYLPYLDRWFEVSSDSVKATFLTLLEDLNPSTPVFLLATTHTPVHLLDPSASNLFSTYRGEVFTVSNPSKEERQDYFKPLFYTQMVKHKKPVKKAAPEPLPVVPVAPVRQLSEKELQRLVEIEEATLTELRIFLRQICAKLARNRQFCIFSQPVDIEDVPDYLDIIKEPMDLETMMTKIDRHEYNCAQDFLKDIDLICANALEYNPNHSPEDQHIRHTACALRDTAYTLIKTEMDTDFEDKCRGIRDRRETRQAKATDTAPDFVYTQPLPSNGSSSNGSSIKVVNGEKTTPNSVGKKKRKRSAWARGMLQKPKKKPHLDKSVDKKEEEFTDDCSKDGELEESVDSTSALNPAEKFASELCDDEISCEDSNEAASSSSCGAPAPSNPDGTSGSPSSRACPPPLPSSTKKAAASANSSFEEMDDLTVSSSEKDDLSQSEGIVDWTHLDAAFANCVSATQEATVGQLQMLHSAIMRLVRRHAATRDKSQLLMEVEDEIRNFVQFKDQL